MLRLNDVHVYYDHIKALNGVSLEAPEGHIVALLGANGAGKTTTINTISALLRPSQGTIEVDGKRIDGLAPDEVVRLGVSQVPEGREIFPLLTVRENLEMGAYIRRGRKQIRDELEYMFDLFPNLRRRVKQKAMTLSGGEQQMLLIGRALMSRPRILLLDEPSLGLSPLLVKEIFQVITKINEEGTTILLVEQNARMAFAVSSYAYILANGEVRVHGPSKDMATNDDVRKSYLGG